jgi:predicted kinase
MIVLMFHAPPLSGKTTVSKEISSKACVSIINYDQIALKMELIKVGDSHILYESDDPLRWRQLFNQVAAICRGLMNAKKVIVLDHHHSKEFQRAQILQLARSFGYQVWLVKLVVRLEERTARLPKRTALANIYDIPITKQQLENWGVVEVPLEHYHRIFEFSNDALSTVVETLLRDLLPYCNDSGQTRLA